jgi:YidC/Oxa1 family membrane protein insertase
MPWIVGLGAGLGIVALTLVLRTVFLPVSWPVAYRGAIRQKKMLRLQPELQRLKLESGGDEPPVYMERMMKLYREHGMTLMDWRSVLGALVQMPLFLGAYRTLRAGANGARFLWVTLSRPDPWFALLAGLTTMLVMAANPDLPDRCG